MSYKLAKLSVILISLEVRAAAIVFLPPAARCSICDSG